MSIDSPMPTGGGSSFGFGNQPTWRPTPVYPAPSPQAQGGATQGQGFPFSIDLGGAAVGALTTLGTAPGFVYSRPAALANAVTGHTTGGGQGIVDQAANFVGGIPVVGDVLRGVGGFLNFDANIAPSVLNARTAIDLKNTAHLPNDAVIPKIDWGGPFASMPLLGQLGALNDLVQNVQKGGITGALNAPTQTVGELRDDAFARGFTPQDIAALQSGQKGIMDFGGLATNRSAPVDAAGRLILDPMNLLLGAGSIANAVRGGVEAARAADAVNGAWRVAEAADLTTAPLTALDGAAAVRQGEAAGVTLGGLSQYLRTVGRGVSDFSSAFRKAPAIDDFATAFGRGPVGLSQRLGRTAASGAITGTGDVTSFAGQLGATVARAGRVYQATSLGMTAGQLGVNALDRALPDNSPLRAPLEGLFQVARTMDEDKTLTNNQLWNLYTAFHAPIRDVASAVTDAAETRWYNAAVVPNILPRLRDELLPGDRSTAAARMTQLEDMFGGKQAFIDFIGHAYSRSLEKFWPAENNLTDAPVRTREEALLHTQNVQKLVAGLNELVGKKIGWRDLYDAIVEWDTNTHNARELTHGLTWGKFDLQRAAGTWREWQGNIAAPLSKVLGKSALVNGGVMDSLLPREHLIAAKGLFEAAAKVGPDGHRYVSPEDAQSIYRRYPALFAAKFDTDSTFRRLLVRDAHPQSLGWINERLNRLIRKSNPMRTYLYPVEAIERRAEKLLQQRGTVLDANGLPDMARVPKMGEAVVQAPTLLNTARNRTGFRPTTLDHVRELRGSEAVRTVEDAVPHALDEAGYNVLSATQGVVKDNGSLSPGTATVLDGAHTDPAMMLSVASHALRASGGKLGAAETAVAIYTGDAMRRWGLQANGVLFRFDVGQMTGAVADRLSNAMMRLGGHAILNDTSGVLQVAYRASEYSDAEQATLNEIAQIAGVNPSREPAWVKVVGNDLGRSLKSRDRRLQGIAPDYTVTGLDRAYATDVRHVGASEFLANPSEYVRANGLAERPAGFVRSEPAEPALSGQANGPGVEHIPLRQRIDRAVNANEGQVTFLAEEDQRVANLTPQWDPQFERVLSPEEMDKIGPIVQGIRQYHPAYQLKITPAHGTPYYLGQGNAMLDEVLARQAVGDTLKYVVWSKLGNIWDAMFRPVMASKLYDDMKQSYYNEVLPAGATVEEANKFLAELEQAARERHLVGNIPFAQRGDLLPSGDINAIAAKVFPEKVVNKIGAGNFWRVLDRSGSRTFRALDERTRGKNQLNALINEWYGRGARDTNAAAIGTVARTVSHYLRSYYHLFRFAADPRFYAYNVMEADTIGLAKYGLDATRFRGAKGERLVIPDETRTFLGQPVGKKGGKDYQVGPTISDAALLHGGSRIAEEGALGRDVYASGYRDARQIQGFIGRAFDVKRLRSTRETLRLLAEEDQSVRALRAKFGGSVEDWVNGLEADMYAKDTLGVRGAIDAAEQTLIDESAARIGREAAQAEWDALAPLKQRLYVQNERIWRDTVATFHGNVNRSNMERLLNSYFLYWPLSYQLKAAKWLFDVMTREAFGKKTNLAGAWTFNRLLQQHQQLIQTDQSYRDMFDANPDIWRTAAMLLPVTPFDLGVGLSKISSYSGSALAAALGLGKYPKNYPQDPFTAAMNMMLLGPLYTYQLAQRIKSEVGQNDREGARDRRAR